MHKKFHDNNNLGNKHEASIRVHVPWTNFVKIVSNLFLFLFILIDL